MSFVIHLHLGNTVGTIERAPARAPRLDAGDAETPPPRPSAWTSRRWGSRRDYEDHLRQTLRELAGTADAGGVSAANAPPDIIPLSEEDLCEVAEEAAS